MQLGKVEGKVRGDADNNGRTGAGFCAGLGSNRCCHLADRCVGEGCRVGQEIHGGGFYQSSLHSGGDYQLRVDGSGSGLFYQQVLH